MARPKESKPWDRSSVIHVRMRPGERADLDVIAEVWGVNPSAAAWAIIAGFLAEARRRRLKDIPHDESGARDTHQAVEAYTHYEEQYAEQLARDQAEAAADEG